ncbi:hypothetical protein MXB_3195 [Myxobolus squamalis]|nr:hypothetical protein MXB_3195 [Myxobolus squamalis]
MYITWDLVIPMRIITSQYHLNNKNQGTFLEWMGLRSSRNIVAIFCALSLIAALYFGHFLKEIKSYCKRPYSIRVSVYQFFSWTFVDFSNNIISPIIEEFVYRSVYMILLLPKLGQILTVSFGALAFSTGFFCFICTSL